MYRCTLVSVYCCKRLFFFLLLVHLGHAMNLKPVVLQPRASAGVASGKTIVSQRMQRESSANRTPAEKSTLVIKSPWDPPPAS